MPPPLLYQRLTHIVCVLFFYEATKTLTAPFLVGIGLGYIVLTAVYYSNTFNGRDIKWMSTNLFGNDGGTYNQTAILTPDNRLDSSKLDQVGLPRYTATYATSQVRGVTDVGYRVRLNGGPAVLQPLFGSIGRAHLPVALERPEERCSLCGL
jgi:hypothetical protein